MRRCWPIVLLLLLIISPVNAKGGPSQAWRLELDGIGPSAASPSVGLAVSSGSRVVLVSKEGNVKWDWTAGDGVTHMAFDAGGNLYVTYSDKLAKLDASGTLRWTRDTYSRAYSLGVLPDGRPVLGYDKGVLCFDEDGKKAWEHYAQEECDT